MFFEMHLTSENELLHAISPVKTIELELLDPQGNVLKNEIMVSHRYEANDYIEAINKAAFLKNALNNVDGINIVRTKVECPVYYHDLWKYALYMEAHFCLNKFPYNYPTSRNIKKTEILGTDRVYEKNKFLEFFNKYQNCSNCELELCLFDDNVDWDKPWFDLWSKNEIV